MSRFPATALGWVVLGAAAAALVGCGSASGGRKNGRNGKGAEGSAQVRRGRFELRVTEIGEFRPLRCRVMIARAGGKIDWLVPEGTAVKKGELLFSQDRTGQNDWLTRDSNELEAAQKNFQEVKRQVQMERESIALDLQVREQSVKLAETRRAEVSAGATKEALAESRAALESARAAAGDARAAADADARMAKDGFLSPAEADASRLAADLADADHGRAQVRLAVLEAGAAKELRETARLEVERAREDVAQARAEAERRNAELDRRVADAESAVANLERSVARAKREIADREVRADADGVVIYRGIGHRGQERVETGTRIWPGAGVLDVAELSRMKVRTQLPERYIRYLSPSSAVRVAPDALPGVELPAKVTWIDRWSRDRSEDLAKADREREGLSGVKVFALEAAVEGQDERIRPGFRGKVIFRLLELPEALIVPRAALYGSGSDRHVLAVGGRELRRVAVEVLAEDEREAAVRGELAEDQQVLTRREL